MDALFELVFGPLEPFIYSLTVGPDLVGNINDCNGATYFSVKAQPPTSPTPPKYQYHDISNIAVYVTGETEFLMSS